MVRAHVFITGDVIGVGFRYWCAGYARRLHITGWVKNVNYPKEGVEAVFEGEKENIEKMVELCKKGPEISWVENIKADYSKPTGEFSDFSIIKSA